MKSLLIAITAGSLLSAPAIAQSADTAQPQGQCQRCELMHNGEKMQGMMVRGDDGTMTCRMMDQSQMGQGGMDHGQMEHGQMEHGTSGHGHMGHGRSSQPSGSPAEPATPLAPSEEDHSAHAGHAPG